MRILFSATTLALVLGLATPSSAQMCGGNIGQAPATAQSGPTAQSGDMAGMGMCGMTGQRIPTAEEMLEGKSAKPQQSAGMMCACCRNMAQMRGGQQGSQGGGMNMPGMEQPKPQ